MAVHKLQIDDFISTDYELIAIHCSVEDYRLAYFLNRTLALQLYKNRISIELRNKNGKSCFEHFMYDDEKNDVCWHLVSNKSVIDATANNAVGLFENITSTSYLVPEFKTADYILKIENVDTIFNLKKTITQIKKIPFIPLVYKIEQDKLKSKNNLIF